MNSFQVQKLYRSLFKAIDKVIPDRIDESRMSEFDIWNDGTVLVDEIGNPMVLYHSYDYETGDNVESSAIYLSANEEFSQEFGDDTIECYVKMRKPYFVPDDGIIRDENGNPFESEDMFGNTSYMTIGDVGDHEDVIDYFVSRDYDGMFDESFEFVIVFDRDNIFRIRNTAIYNDDF